MRFALVNGISVVKYPLHLREEYPLVSFPSTITPSDLPTGVVIVEDSPVPPNTNATTVTGEGVPEFVGGVWRRTWDTRPASQAEQKAYLDKLDREALASDPHIAALRDATPAQVRAYIDSHLANLGTTQGQDNLRQDMKTLAVAIGFIAREVFK